MKKNQLFFLLLIASNMFAYGPNEIPTQEINTPVQSAIIYLYGAEVTQSKQVTLNPGRNKIVFVGLSPKINSKSIQVNVTNGISILAISNAINYMSHQKEGNRIEQLKDSASSLIEAISEIKNNSEAYEIEKAMLLKNDDFGGKEKGVEITELKLAADFYRSRIKEINSEISKLNKRSLIFNESLSKINQQLAELNAKSNQPTAEVSILLSSPIKTSTIINIKYLVTDAGWSPDYDIYATDINQPIDLKYRAKVFNNTGVDWNDIKLKLSTADPSKSAAKPILSTWELGYLPNGKKKFYLNSALSIVSQTDGLSKRFGEDKKINEPKQNQTSQPKTEIVELEIAELSTEFEIKNNYTIPSDFKPYIVDVTEYKLPASYKHFSVPKLDGAAFLLARITGWEELDLVEGPANIYYSGAFIGQSYIQTSNANDTLDLSLGHDDKVLVTRTKIKEFSSRNIIGGTTKETFTYEIVVKNNRKTSIQIEIVDQLPISMNSDIVVDAIETSKGEFDAKTGEYKWEEALQPGEAKKIKFSYSVKYPKNAKINFHKTTTHMNVRFM